MVVTTSAVRKILPHVEFVYAVIALFALTQGPVYRLWSGSAESLVVSAKTSLPHVYFATFVAVQLPALIVVARMFTVEMLRNRSMQALVALHVWLGCTVLWSTLARHSLPEFIALVFTTFFGIFLVLRFRPIQFWWVVLTAMTIGLLLSVLAVYRVWEAARDLNDGFWIGIYYNRNSLAPVAGVALIASFGVLATGWVHHGVRRNLSMLGTIVLGALSVIVLWQAESRTTPFALMVAFLALILWQVLRIALRKVRISLIRNIGAARLSVGLVALGVFLALQNVASLSGVPAETSTFNSRAALWSQNWTGFLERPLHGWGWMAARQTEQFFEQGIWWATFPTEWTHNGYHELLLGGGVLAGALFVYLLLSSLGNFTDSPGHANSIRFVTVCFVLVAATQESFFIGSHFLWAMLIWGLLRVNEEQPQIGLVDQEHATKRTT